MLQAMHLLSTGRSRGRRKPVRDPVAEPRSQRCRVELTGISLHRALPRSCTIRAIADAWPWCAARGRAPTRSPRWTWSCTRAWGCRSSAVASRRWSGATRTCRRCASGAVLPPVLTVKSCNIDSGYYGGVLEAFKYGRARSHTHIHHSQ